MVFFRTNTAMSSRSYMHRNFSRRGVFLSLVKWNTALARYLSQSGITYIYIYVFSVWFLLLSPSSPIDSSHKRTFLVALHSCLMSLKTTTKPEPQHFSLNNINKTKQIKIHLVVSFCACLYITELDAIGDFFSHFPTIILFLLLLRFFFVIHWSWWTETTLQKSHVDRFGLKRDGNIVPFIKRNGG